MGRKLVAAGLLFLAATVQAAGDRLLLWEVDTPGSRTWLLGSMHLARPDIYPLRSEIVEAFNAADSLVVEIDIGGASRLAIQERMLARGAYPAGRSIRDELSAATWQELERRLDAAGLPAAAMESLKPGLVVTTLTTMEMVKLGLSPELGIDAHFLGLARGRKAIVELETVERQLSLLLDFPEPDLLVRQTLHQIDSLERILGELEDAWKRGDAEDLRRLVLDDELARHPEFEPLHERMFYARNRAMTERIAALQRRGGRQFVVVGAGHLLGDRGIVALLEKRGQKPRRL